MKQKMSFLTIGLIVVGFLVPIAWGFAVITFFLGACLAPPGKRLDGKRKTGGLFGGLWDDFQDSNSSKKCPFCSEIILNDAIVCKHCQRDLDPQGALQSSTAIKYCSYCHAKNRMQDITCINCGKPV